MINSISGAASGMMPQVVSGASMRQPPAQRMANLFDKIDTEGLGSITKSQFDQSFQTLRPPKGLQVMGADTIFSQLDPNNTGSVSKDDFVTRMTKVLEQMHAQQRAHRKDGDADDMAVASQTHHNRGDQSFTDMVNAISSLETALGGQPSSATEVVKGTLFDGKA